MYHSPVQAEAREIGLPPGHAAIGRVPEDESARPYLGAHPVQCFDRVADMFEHVARVNGIESRGEAVLVGADFHAEVAAIIGEGFGNLVGLGSIARRV